MKELDIITKTLKRAQNKAKKKLRGLGVSPKLSDEELLNKYGQ